MLPNIEWWEVLIRLFGAIICGGLFGLEREFSGHPAGLRTHILVCLGACLVMLISLYGFDNTADPARLAAQVVSGIGFLGAGAIIREGGDIKGITTAAALWIVAIVGLAIGNGAYLAAAITTVSSIILMILLRSLQKKLGRRSQRFVIILDGQKPMLKKLVEICDELDVIITHVEAKTVEWGNVDALQISASFNPRTAKTSISTLFIEIEDQLKPLSIKLK